MASKTATWRATAAVATGGDKSKGNSYLRIVVNQIERESDEDGNPVDVVTLNRTFALNAFPGVKEYGQPDAGALLAASRALAAYAARIQGAGTPATVNNGQVAMPTPGQ